MTDDPLPPATGRPPTPRPASGDARPQSTSGRRADLDLELLARPELRAVRLLLEYLKPELSFLDQGVRNTVVVFGGTRLLDPETAQARLDALDPDDAVGRRRAGAALERSRY